MRRKKETKNDIDLDMTDISGQTVQKQEEKHKEILKETLDLAKQEASEMYEWTTLVERLENRTKNKTWLGIPVLDESGRKIKEEHKEIADCTNEEFVSWINFTYPPAKSMKHKPNDYDTVSSRELAFMGIMKALGSITIPVN